MDQTNTHKTAARMFGGLFILAFLSYGIGSGLTAKVTGAPDVLAAISIDQPALIIGAILMAIVHSAVNVGVGSIMLVILKPFNNTMAYGYFGAVMLATVMLAIGAVFLLMLAPLSQSQASAATITTLASLLSAGNFYAYQIGMALWGIGGLLLAWLLYISRIVPRIFAFWGGIGYAIFIAGTVFELSGIAIGTFLSIPGGLFEIALSLWLIFKGFTPRSAAN